MKLFKCISLVITLVAVVSCSSKKNLDYLESRNGKKLVINAPLKSSQIEREYFLPNIDKVEPASIEPPISE